MSTLPSPVAPELLTHFQQTNPQFMEQYKQIQQEQNATAPAQAAAPAPVKSIAPTVSRRPSRPSISGGRLFHSRPFQHLGKKK